jgi:hypothetical protein
MRGNTELSAQRLPRNRDVAARALRQGLVTVLASIAPVLNVIVCPHAKCTHLSGTSFQSGPEPFAITIVDEVVQQAQIELKGRPIVINFGRNNPFLCGNRGIATWNGLLQLSQHSIESKLA